MGFVFHLAISSDRAKGPKGGGLEEGGQGGDIRQWTVDAYRDSLAIGDFSLKWEFGGCLYR